MTESESFKTVGVKAIIAKLNRLLKKNKTVKPLTEPTVGGMGTYYFYPFKLWKRSSGNIRHGFKYLWREEYLHMIKVMYETVMDLLSEGYIIELPQGMGYLVLRRIKLYNREDWQKRYNEKYPRMQKHTVKVIWLKNKKRQYTLTKYLKIKVYRSTLDWIKKKSNKGEFDIMNVMDDKDDIMRIINNDKMNN